MKGLSQIKSIMDEMTSKLLDLIYPASLYCISCGKVIDDTRPYRLCNDCMQAIGWANDRTCAKCGRPLSDRNPYDVCHECRDHSHNFRRGYTCATYGEHEKKIIFDMKYNGHPDIAKTIAEIMHDRLELIRATEGKPVKYDLIVPVPLHRSKQIKRGFNQAGLIAGELSLIEGTAYSPDLVIRRKKTGVMNELGAAERIDNIRGAFEISGNCPPRSILVVDDIMTTGSTLDEMAKMLYACGAEAVDVITFASGRDAIYDAA